MIHGAMETHLDEANKGDLCVLAAPIEKDRLTNFLTSIFKVSLGKGNVLGFGADGFAG